MTERGSREIYFDECTCDHTGQCGSCRMAQRLESTRSVRINKPTKSDSRQGSLNAFDNETIEFGKDSLQNILKGDRNWDAYVIDVNQHQMPLLLELHERLKPGEKKDGVALLIKNLETAIKERLGK